VDLSGRVDAIEADFQGYSYVGMEEFLAEHATWVRSLSAVQSAARKILAKQAGRGVRVTFSKLTRPPTEPEVFSAPRATGTITVHPDTGEILLLTFTATRSVKGVEETFAVNLPYGPGGIGPTMVGGGFKTGVFPLSLGDHGDFDRTGDGLEPLHRDMSGGYLTLYAIDAVKGTASGYVWFNSDGGVTIECYFGLKGLDVVEGIPFIPGPI